MDVEHIIDDFAFDQHDAVDREEAVRVGLRVRPKDT